MSITSHDSLRSLRGLSALQTIGGGLTIMGNHELDSLEELSALTSVGGNLTIYNNSSLCEDDVWTFASSLDVGGEISISDNDGDCS